MTEPLPAQLASQVRRLWWLIGAVLAAGVWFFFLRGADQPRDPYFLDEVTTTTAAPAPSSAGARAPLPGFGETAVKVTLPSGQELSWCLLLAATEAQREQGLMNVTDPTLGGYDGMVFRFDTDFTGRFYMKDTPQPLSIAFFAADGSFVDEADMQPCPEQTTSCPTYGPGKPYRNAIEVPLGGLDALGIGPGAVFTDERVPCPA